MSQFSYKDGVLHAESASLSAIAEQFGTPAYVYSKAQLLANFASYADACAGRDALVCYAMKANSNLAILDLLARKGAGFDIVSGGELLRVLAAGGDPRKVIFSGVGKSVEEMRLALSHDILCFNVESIPELHRLNEVAGALGKTARISLRVNPNVDPKTHPYIATGLKASKFGVAFDDALATYRAAAKLPHLEVAGIDCHIGSQLLDDAPLLEALDRLIELDDGLLEVVLARLHPPVVQDGQRRDQVDQAVQLLGQRRPRRLIMPLVLVAASGISSTKAMKPTVMKGRLSTSFHIAATSKKWSNHRKVRKCRRRRRTRTGPSMRRSLISQFQPLRRRSGVTASVAHSRYKAQSPVPWVMNSTGSTRPGWCRSARPCAAKAAAPARTRLLMP
jgi:hypothetical protein